MTRLFVWWGRSVPRPRAVMWSMLSAAMFTLALPGTSAAQTTPDFDICDFCGTLQGNTAFLTGRSGFGTTRGVFRIINAATSDQDVDRDGWQAGVTFQNLVVSDTSDFVNVENPAIVILRENFVLGSFLNPLNSGLSRDIIFFVNIPQGTPAGRYRGRATVTDLAFPPGLNANAQTLRLDYFDIEVEVLAASGIGLVQSDTGARADSLLLRGRAGQTVSGVVRVANLGNVQLQNVRFDIEDLVATSGTGLRVRAQQVSFGPASITNVALGDSARVTVTVRIPVGLLAGRYQGALTVQADDVDPLRIPVILEVLTPGDIVFEANPVRGRAGDLAVVIFNGDPGSNYSIRIFDMIGITAFAHNGQVFPGGGGGGTGPFAGDQAVRFVWPLVNGQGHEVAGGMYLVVVEAVQNGQRRVMRSKLMVIR